METNGFDLGKSSKSNRIPLLPPPDVITIDEDEEEDLGRPIVMASSDDLNLKDSQSHSPFTTTDFKPKLNIKRPDRHPFDDNREASNGITGRSNVVPDGSSTVMLRKRFNEQERQESSDPIDNFDSTPGTSSKLPEGNVRKKVALYEGHDNNPRIDLRQVTVKSNTVKGKMKPKSKVG